MVRYQNIIDEIAEINLITGAPELTSPVQSILSGANKALQIAVLSQFVNITIQKKITTHQMKACQIVI
jgi:hypothetical protein